MSLATVRHVQKLGLANVLPKSSGSTSPRLNVMAGTKGFAEAPFTASPSGLLGLELAFRLHARENAGQALDRLGLALDTKASREPDRR